MSSLVEKIPDFIDWVHSRISGKRMAPETGLAVQILVISEVLRLFSHIVKHPLHMLAIEGFVEGRLFIQLLISI